MADEIKIVYDQAEDMASTFQKGAEQIDETRQQVEGIAGTLEAGALLGQGGTAFVEAIRSKLSPALTRLADKFRELEGDVQAAIQAMREADAEAQGKFQ